MPKKHEINDSDEEWEDWNSEVEDAMDDDDIISVDEYEGEENISFIIDIIGNENVNFTSNKRRACNGLCSASDSIRAKECNGFVDETCRNKICCTACLALRFDVQLKNQIFVPIPKPENIKHTPSFWFENDPIKKGSGRQNLKYSKEFTSFLVILGSFSNRVLDLFQQNLKGRTIQSIRQLKRNENDYFTNPDLCYENVTRFKRLIDTLHYKGPIVAMTDNTKLKIAVVIGKVGIMELKGIEPRITSNADHYPNNDLIRRGNSIEEISQLHCIVELTFNNNETKISDYDQINQIINKIKSKKAFASSVRVYILQVPLSKFPPVVIALIPNNGSDKTADIAQTLIQSMSIDERLQMIDTRFDVTFSCPIILSVGPVLRVQDPKHTKKTCQNVIMSGARVLSFERSTAHSVMYKQDVVKLDRQDDAAAYRAFCSSNLKTVYLQHLENSESEEMCGFFVLLFIFGELIDCYLNQKIKTYPNFISLKKNFLADQSYSILVSLAESMVLLVKAYQEYYPSIPLLLWMYGSEAAEYFFGIAR
ncbi:hypothetical protein RhiirA4_473138 [Rhizophagus irregularis]|uniref:Uncharacterized protein n=1 Tax=Rhizophagus irregularis TaxID=588596 RepID=A0A2I1H6A8_9GLOM|nr:hypothetical protein RhiirA4_473138 [Rhizophagus irregularis]